MGDAIDPLTNRHMSGRPAARGPAQAAWDRGNPGYAQRWDMQPQQPAPPAASSGQAQPKQSPYASSAQYGQPAVMGWPDPPQSPPAQPQGAFARLSATPQFQSRIANSSPRMAAMHTENLRNIAAKQDRLASKHQYTPEENRAMMQEWQALRGTEISTPLGSRRIGGATNEQVRALRNDPASARRLAELRAWRVGAPPPGQEAPLATQSPGQAQPQQSPYAGSSPYGQPAQTAAPQRPPAVPPQSPAPAGMNDPAYREWRMDRITDQRYRSPAEQAAFEQRMYDEWASGQARTQPPARPPSPPAAQQRPALQAGDPGASIRSLLQGFNVPQGVMDQLAGLMGGGQGQPVAPAQSPAAYTQSPAGGFVPGVNYTSPLADAQRQVEALRQQQFPQMPSPPPGFGQFGTPQAQQQMYQDSMMAWTMPKQNLLSWGQQAVQKPWAPNYGNMPANSRPMPYEISYNNPFGSSPMDITQNRDAFIGSILNNQANRFVGTQTQPGPVNRPAYDPSQLWQQAQSMLGGGWQNPFAAR